MLLRIDAQKRKWQNECSATFFIKIPVPLMKIHWFDFALILYYQLIIYHTFNETCITNLLVVLIRDILLSVLTYYKRDGLLITFTDKPKYLL